MDFSPTGNGGRRAYLDQLWLRLDLFFYFRIRTGFLQIFCSDTRHRRHTVTVLRLDQVDTPSGTASLLHILGLDADRNAVGGDDRQIIGFLHDARRDNLADITKRLRVNRGNPTGGASLGGISAEVFACHTRRR